MNDCQHPAKRRILVVANATAQGAFLHEAIRDRVGESEAEVLVVATALRSRPGDWTSDPDEAFGGRGI